jgi:hypothetical protein
VPDDEPRPIGGVVLAWLPVPDPPLDLAAPPATQEA